MAIVIRCGNCKKFYTLKHPDCPYCEHKDKTKAYYIRYQNKDTYAGNSLQIAKQDELKLKLDYRLGKHPSYQKETQLTFKGYMDKHFRPHFSKNRGASREFMFAHFETAFGDKLLAKVTPADVEATVTSRSKGLSAGTFNHYVATIKRIFNYAIELQLINVSPVRIKKVVNDNRRLRFLSKEEAEKLLQSCISPRLREMVYIALYTGMRLGEIQALRPNDVRDGAVYVRAETTKSSKGRIIPLPASIKDFFTTATFDYKHDIKNSFRGAMKRAGISNFRFHDLRHTYASWLVQSGVDLYVVQQLLGHASIVMTQRYAHLAPNALKDAVDRLI